METKIEISACATVDYHTKKVHAREGFTLIEILITSAITVIVAGGAYGCLRAAISTQSMVNERMDNMQTARSVIRLITEDLRATTPMLGESEFLGLDRIIKNAEGDNIDFATKNYSYSRPGEADFCEVSYFVTSSDVEGELILMRRRDPTPDTKPIEGGQIEMIARGLRYLKFEYYDGVEWYDDWGSTDNIKPDQDSLLLPGNLYGIPSAVRISLSFAKPSDNPGQTIRTRQPGSKQEAPANLQTIVFIHASTKPDAKNSQGGSEI